MRDLDKALADIVTIRSHIAASTTFHGLGPGALFATSVVAIVTALAQAAFFAGQTLQPLTFFLGWIVAAFLCAIIVGLEMLSRSRRHHSRLADAVIYNAIEQFLPSAVAGIFLGVFIALFAPRAAWLLPGVWQVLTGLGIFASARSLPHRIKLVGGWYFVAGFATLVIASGDHLLSPWTMGMPYALGQTLAALVFHLSPGQQDGQA